MNHEVIADFNIKYTSKKFRTPPWIDGILTGC